MIDKTVIVGHGSSLVDRRLGEYIDSFRYVIRFFHSPGWQTPIDYGTKVSYYCATNAKAKLLLNMPKPDIKYFIWSKHNRVASFGEDVTELICSWQSRLPKGTYPYLSQGTSGICIATSEIGKPVVVLGCDALKVGEPDSTKYIRADGKTYRKTSRWHSFDAERKLVNAMSAEYDVNVELSDNSPL